MMKNKRNENQSEMELEIEERIGKNNKEAYGRMAKYVYLKESWYCDILRRLLQNYSYKVSIYIIFKATSKIEKKQMEKLKKELGISWFEKDEIKKEIEIVKQEIFEMYRSDVMKALIESSCSPEGDGYKDRRLYFVMMR